MEKIGDSWSVVYKDSLSTKGSAQCRAAAGKILLVLSMALGQYLRMPDGICNKAFQPLGSGLCDQFVAHWCDEAARRCNGEGQMATGWPDTSKWISRVQSVVVQILKSDGMSKLKDVRAEKKK